MDLCAITDVEASLGRSLSPDEQARAIAVVALVSERYKIAAGQGFEAGTSTVRLLVRAGRAYLPERPVTSVASVVTDDLRTVTYTLTGQWLDLLWGGTTDKVGTGTVVTVTYTHSALIPALDRLTVAEAAARRLNAQPSNLTSRTDTMGPYTTTENYAAWTAGSILSPDEVKVAQRWLPPHGPVVMRS